MAPSSRVPGSAERTRSGVIAGLPAAASRVLDDAGLGVLGALTVADYDALVPAGWRRAALLPEARSVLVVGSGGQRLAHVALARGGADPVDRATARAVAAAVTALERAGCRALATHAFERRDGRGRRTQAGGAFADFVALGEAAGLGVRSRLRQLLHPLYGPWLGVRSAVLTTARLGPTVPLADFAPCTGCPAPCARACPGHALDAGPLDWDRCLPERLAGGACALRCAARRACVIGRAHAPDADVEAHFMRSSLRLLPP